MPYGVDASDIGDGEEGLMSSLNTPVIVSVVPGCKFPVVSVCIRGDKCDQQTRR